MDTRNILFNDTMNWANLTASAAVRAFFIVDRCKVINKGNSAVGASLCALTASDTSVRAELAHYRALIVAGAENKSSVNVGHKLDNVVGASSCAYSAADAKLAIDESNTVLNTYRVLGARLCAVAKTYATEGASARAAVKHIGSLASLYTLVFKSLLYRRAVSVALNDRNHFNDVLSLFAENSCDRLRGRVATGYTEICFEVGVVNKCLSITVTACVAACAAVCTGQALTDLGESFIHGNTHKFICKNENDSADKTKNYCNYTCKNNSFHCPTSLLFFTIALFVEFVKFSPIRPGTLAKHFEKGYNAKKKCEKGLDYDLT